MMHDPEMEALLSMAMRYNTYIDQPISLLLKYLCRPEVNIQPWEVEFQSIEKGSDAIKWKDRVEFAYWKGNPDVASPLRVALLSCNDTDKRQAPIFRQVPKLLSCFILNINSHLIISVGQKS
jgi:hypothetical protein